MRSDITASAFCPLSRQISDQRISHLHFLNCHTAHFLCQFGGMWRFVCVVGVPSKFPQVFTPTSNSMPTYFALPTCLTVPCSPIAARDVFTVSLC